MGNCSLRDAVIAANAAAGPDVIHVPAGTYTLGGAAGEDLGATGDLDVMGGALTVDGAGASSTIIDGANNDRIFDVLDATSDLTLSGLTLTGGKAGQGAAVQALGTVTLDGVTVTGNTAGGSGVDGFGSVSIRNAAAGNANLTVTNSTISSNHAGGGGGQGFGPLFVLPNGNANVTVTNSQIVSNVLGGTGGQGFGALFIQASSGKTLTLSLSGDRFADNHAGGDGGGNGFGGGLSIVGPGGSATISDSSFTGNTAGGGGAGGGTGFGGAVFLQPDNGFDLTVSRSTFSGNSAGIGSGGFGGAIFMQLGSTGAVTLTNTTVSGNTSGAKSGSNAFGGGLFLQSGGATAALQNTTIAGNSAADSATTGSGGGIFAMGSVSATNTIVAGNLASGTPNGCSAVLTSAGHNLEDGTSCGFTELTDITANPLLAPLGDYGGPTQTQALLPGSPAIDHGSGCPATDERGFPRPFGAACDIGAYEFAPPAPTTGAASKRKPRSAELDGSILPNLRAASFHFEFGKSTAYGSQSSEQSAGGGLAPVAVTAAISGLTPGTTYHYRLVATGDATVAGSDATFKTPFAAPSLRRLHLSRSTFRAAGAGGSLAAKPRTGTDISYTVSDRTRTTFKILKPVAGRRQGKSCRKPSARNRHSRACTRLVSVGSFAHKDKTGRNKLHFTGRVRHHKLAPGKYRLRATPRAHSKNGKSVTARFKVIR